MSIEAHFYILSVLIAAFITGASFRGMPKYPKKEYHVALVAAFLFWLVLLVTAVSLFARFGEHLDAHWESNRKQMIEKQQQ